MRSYRIRVFYCSYKKREFCTQRLRETQTEHRVKTEAETGVMLPQAKDTKDCPKLAEKQKADSPSEPPEGTHPANTLI